MGIGYALKMFLTENAWLARALVCVEADFSSSDARANLSGWSCFCSALNRFSSSFSSSSKEIFNPNISKKLISSWLTFCTAPQPSFEHRISLPLMEWPHCQQSRGAAVPWYRHHIARCVQHPFQSWILRTLLKFALWGALITARLRAMTVSLISFILQLSRLLVGLCWTKCCD